MTTPTRARRTPAPRAPNLEHPLARRLLDLLAGDGRAPRERGRLVDLMTRLGALPPPPDPLGIFGSYPQLHAGFLDAAHGDDPDVLEDSFAELYCHLHGHEAPYTTDEREVMNSAGGYWCHAGGLSPILKAGDYLEAAMVSADFGAGNGLQGLLMQLLYPHAMTVQIELSRRMIECGQQLQRWLGIAPERVSWRVADVRSVAPDGMDFIYLYRPLRPVGTGADFYRALATQIAHTSGRMVIFSVADCLGPLLPKSFVTRYFDGHLTCLERPAPEGTAQRG